MSTDDLNDDPSFIACTDCGKNSKYGVIGFRNGGINHRHYCTTCYYKSKKEWVPKNKRVEDGKEIEAVAPDYDE